MLSPPALFSVARLPAHTPGDGAVLAARAGVWEKTRFDCRAPCGLGACSTLPWIQQHLPPSPNISRSFIIVSDYIRRSGYRSPEEFERQEAGV